MVKVLFLFCVIFLLFSKLSYGVERVDRFYYDYVSSYSYGVLGETIFSGLAVWQSGDMYMVVSERPVYSSLKEAIPDFLMSGFRGSSGESKITLLPSFLTVTVIKDQTNATTQASVNMTSLHMGMEEDRVLYSKEYVVYFNLNRFNLTKSEKKKLDDIVLEWKNKCSEDCEIRARVSGSACYLGSNKYNKNLSLKRSNEVIKYLSQKLKNLVVVSREGRGEVYDSDVICLNRKVIVKLECFCKKRDKN